MIADDTREKLRGLLEPDVMRSADAVVNIQVRDVLSGEDHLGRGTVKAALRDGQLDIDPLELDIPSGEVKMALGLDRSDADIKARIQVDIERLDYGIPARRIDPDTQVAGLVSINADLRFQGDELEGLLRSASGHLDFAVWPENLRGDVFDVWAVNLFFAILPRLDPESASRVNCLIADLELNDGRMKDKLLVLDTSTVRVKGSGVIDLQSEEVDLLLKPAPKRARFFSLATPLVVGGSFSDFRVGVAPGGLLGTALRLSYAYVVVPFQLLTQRSPPRDGADICLSGADRSIEYMALPTEEIVPREETGGFMESPVP